MKLCEQQREKAAISHDAFSTGLALKAEGLESNYPVVMVSLAVAGVWP